VITENGEPFIAPCVSTLAYKYVSAAFRMLNVLDLLLRVFLFLGAINANPASYGT